MIPVVSVIIPSFNHEKFIQECIQSVLDQTFQDFEIVITDDGSLDRTVEIIEGFSDPRIKLFKHEFNKGASAAANHCILNSSGKYIAMLSSDDAWYPNKLDVQVKFLDAHPDVSAVFGKVDWMDEKGNSLRMGFPYNNIFDVENRDRFKWLRHFFLVGNSLCHPCSLIRRENYFDVGLLNPSFSSLPDFDLWVRFCLKYNIYILDQPLVRFRRINDQKNASGNNVPNRVRNRFEYKKILDHFLSIQDPKELLLIFPESVNYGIVSPETIPYFFSRMAINTGVDFMMLWGLENIYLMLKDDLMVGKLEKQCNFNHLSFIKLSGECDVFKVSILPVYALFPLQAEGNPGRFDHAFLILKKYMKDVSSIFRAFFFLFKNLVRDFFQL